MTMLASPLRMWEPSRKRRKLFVLPRQQLQAPLLAKMPLLKSLAINHTLERAEKRMVGSGQPRQSSCHSEARWALICCLVMRSRFLALIFISP
jgi:flagellar biosynthesis/type III secretory pathway chaperone